MGKYIIAFIALLLGLGVMAYAWTQISDIQKIYDEGNALYEDLRSQAKGNSASDAPESPKSPKVYIPKLDIDFEELKNINEDSTAWLYSPDTVIDYPVMKAADYNYYLSHLPDGTWNANGSLFIDYNNAPDFSDRLTVIYGHHMKSGSMFGNLKGYKSQEYFDEHPYMYLYTDQGNYRIDLMYGSVIGAGQWREQAFMFEENTDALLAYAEFNTTFDSGVRHSKNDRIVVLSTCSYEFDNARYFVVGKLTPEY